MYAVAADSATDRRNIVISALWVAQRDKTQRIGQNVSRDLGAGAGLSQRHYLSAHAGKDYPLTIGGRDGGLLPTRIDTLLVVFVRIPEKFFLPSCR